MGWRTMWVLETTLVGSGITSFRIIGARLRTRGSVDGGSVRPSAPRTRVLRPTPEEGVCLFAGTGRTSSATRAGAKNGLLRSDYRDRRDGRRPRARAGGAVAPRALRANRRGTRPRGALRAVDATPAGEPPAARAARPLDARAPRTSL